MCAELIEVIHVTKSIGYNQEGVPIHGHDEYYTADGTLLADHCDGNYCEEFPK